VRERIVDVLAVLRVGRSLATTAVLRLRRATVLWRTIAAPLLPAWSALRTALLLVAASSALLRAALWVTALSGLLRTARLVTASSALLRTALRVTALSALLLLRSVAASALGSIAAATLALAPAASLFARSNPLGRIAEWTRWRRCVTVRSLRECALRDGQRI
jgi:hypothetical protein